MQNNSSSTLTNRQGLWIAIVIIIILVGVLVAVFANKKTKQATTNIQNYAECIAAGYPSLETYPAQCKTADGRTFVQDVNANGNPNGTDTENNGNNGNNNSNHLIYGTIGGKTTDLSDQIKVTSPLPDVSIKSPITISGEARGNWYFEASFPIQLLDADGKILAQKPVAAKGSWMTSNFVPFSISLSFPTPTTQTGTIVLMNDNPSGNPATQSKLFIPVRFSGVDMSATTDLKVYFLTSNAAKKDCSDVTAITRTVPKTLGVAEAAIDQLLLGPTTTEKTAGYISPIPTKTTLNKITILNGIATVDFNDSLDVGVAGSCNVIAIRSEIEKTLLQFPSVTKVIITKNGKSAGILQP